MKLIYFLFDYHYASDCRRTQDLKQLHTLIISDFISIKLKLLNCMVPLFIIYLLSAIVFKNL